MGVERTTPRERMLKQGVVIFLLTILVIAFLSLEVQILLETKACNDFENMVPSTNYGNMNHTLCSYIKQFKSINFSVFKMWVGDPLLPASHSSLFPNSTL